MNRKCPNVFCLCCKVVEALLNYYDNLLVCLGVGLIAEPISGLNFRLDYAPPLIDLDDNGGNIQEDGCVLPY